MPDSARPAWLPAWGLRWGAAALIAALALAGCAPPAAIAPGRAPNQAPSSSASPAAATPRSGGTLRYGLTLAVSGIDPHIHASSELGIPLSSVYDTLVAQDKQGQFHPYMASSWNISGDGRTYTFKLRQDVKFHDGTPFDAQAAVRNLQRIADPATKSQKAVFLLGPFDHAEAVDPYTLKIVLKQPYPPLLDGLSQVYVGMASPAALDKWGDQYQLHQVGSGPFRMASFQQGNSLTLERNPDYAWAPDIRAHRGPAYLDRIVFTFYGDPATRLPALLAGQADVMGELPPRDAQQIAASQVTPGSKQNFELLPIPVPGQSVQFFLNTALPPLDDQRLREALLYATDRSGLVSAVFGPTSPVAEGPLTAATRDADPNLKGRYPYDVDRARQLLASAGWTAGPDGMLQKDGKPLALRGILMSWGELPQIGTILQGQWRKLGIDLKLDQMSYPAALQAGHANTYHMLPFSISATDPSLLNSFFHSGAQFNWANVNDPEVDAWLDQAGRTSDRAQQTALYAKVQERVMDRAWILPIRDPVNLNAAAGQVQGLTYDVQGWFPVLYDVWLK